MFHNSRNCFSKSILTPCINTEFKDKLQGLPPLGSKEINSEEIPYRTSNPRKVNNRQKHNLPSALTAGVSPCHCSVSLQEGRRTPNPKLNLYLCLQDKTARMLLLFELAILWKVHLLVQELPAGFMHKYFFFFKKEKKKLISRMQKLIKHHKPNPKP